jgi:peptidoglycan/LPS O-acetylase OafA/YrhL
MQIKFNHRSDIDALRALAILAVIGFHFFPNVFPYGFLGVDLFFVISGYLITKLLQDQLLTNTFSYLLFYLKRIRRIFPALLVMLCVTSIAAAFILTAPDLERYAKSQLATLSFVANIYFWRTGGYFSTTDELKPLLHMWSLGVEEQFYIFFPLVLAITLKLFKSIQGRLVVIALISACSYTVNIYLTSIGGANPVFFLLPTRIWQFGFGCFFAIMPLLELKKYRINSSILFSLALLLISTNLIAPMNAIPSATLLSLGAGLILWNGLNQQSILSQLCSAKSIQIVGLSSFSLYLWHWPILVFLKYIYIDELGTHVLFIALIFTFVISYLSWAYIENPFRRATSTKSLLFFVTSIYLVLTGLAVLTITSAGYPGRDSNLINSISSAVDSNYRCPPSSYRLYGASRSCLIGDLDTKPSIALLGNSHAQMYAPAIEQGLSKKRQAGLIIPLNGCLPTVNINISEDCLKMASINYESLKKDGSIKTVVIAMTWYADNLVDRDGNTIIDANFSYREKAILSLMDNLSKAGKSVYLVAPIAIPNFDFASQASRALKFNKGDIPFSKSRVEFDKKYGLLVESLSNKLGIRLIKPHEVFCDINECFFADSQGAYFSDGNHVSFYGASRLKKIFEPIYE